MANIYSMTVPIYNGFEFIYEFDFSTYNQNDRTVTAKADVYLNTPYACEVLMNRIPDFAVYGHYIYDTFYNFSKDAWVFQDFTKAFSDAQTDYFGGASGSGTTQYPTYSYSKGKNLLFTIEASQSYSELVQYGFYDAVSPGAHITVSTSDVNGRSFFVDGNTDSSENYYKLMDYGTAGTSDWGKVTLYLKESGSGELTKPDAFASSISCATTYIGETANIIIKKNDSSFTTTITYTFGSLTGTIVESYSGTSYRWQVPASFVNELASDETEKVCILTCTTYDSKGNQVGQSSNLQVTLLLDSSVGGPKFTSFTIQNSDTEEAWEIGPKILELTGDPTVLVKYFSYAYAYATAQGQSGATVVDIKVQNSGKTADNGVKALGPVESPEFTFVATDSRGFTSSATYLANWVDYSKLSCNAYIDIPTPFGDSSAVIEGNCFNGSFGAVNNELKLEYTLHPQGETGTWVEVNATPTEWHNYNVNLTFSDIDYKKTYVFQARATDKLMTITTPELIVTGEPIFDWGKEDFHIRVPLSLGNEITMETDKAIAVISPTGEVINAFTPCNSSGDAILGYGGYTGENGDTYIYGDSIHLIANKGVTINGNNYDGSKILWQGANLMGENTSITFSDTVDNQQNGILLVFSLYRNNAAEDVSITTAFIGKKEIELLPGAPHFYLMGINAGMSVIGAKYLYVANDGITGHSGNTTSGTAASGITFNNNNFVLRYVIGV